MLDNDNPNYMDGPGAQNDLPITLPNLVDHLFDHGHMGYYPHAKTITQTDHNAVVFIDPSVARRGVFTVSNVIRTRIFPNILTFFNPSNGDTILRGNLPTLQGYAVDPGAPQQPTLNDAACNLIKKLFSSDRFNNIAFGQIQRVNGADRFTIDATYNGAVTIEGIDYRPPASVPPAQAPAQAVQPSLGLKMQRFQNGVPAAADYTNEIRMVVEVRNGRIRIVSLFPLG